MAHRSRSGGHRLFPREWIIRGFLILLVIVLGYFSILHSLATVLQYKWPGQAYAMAPWDGRIAARFSRELSGVDASDAKRVKGGQVALKALALDPTAVPAVATLGLNAQIRGDAAKASQLFHYSKKLSRRDLQTQLWAIEDAVGRDDIPGVMEAYDIALRTSRFTPKLLYPILTEAMRDPEIERSLVATLSKKPLWIDSFIDHAVRNGEATASARLLRDLSNARVLVSQEAYTNTVEALIKEGRFSDAWNFYRSIRPGVSRRASRDPNFKIALEYPSSFDWQPVTASPGTVATIQPDQRTGFFDFAAPSTVGGIVLQQAQLAPPGNYVLEGHGEMITQSPDAQPYWLLKCSDDRKLGQVDMQNSADGRVRFIGNITVPHDCSVQYLSLVLRPSNSVSGVSGRITHVLLRALD